MPEEWFEVMHNFWTDEYVLTGKKKSGPFKQEITRSQVAQIESLQSAHDIEMQNLMRSFVSE